MARFGGVEPIRYATDETYQVAVELEGLGTGPVEEVHARGEWTTLWYKDETIVEVPTSSIRRIIRRPVALFEQDQRDLERNKDEV